MRIEKLKDGLAVPIPDDVVKDLELKEGDEIVVSRGDGNQIVIQKASDLDDALTALRKYRRPWPAGYKFDREEANARR